MKRVKFYISVFIGMVATMPIIGRAFFYVSRSVLAVCAVVMFFCIVFAFCSLCDDHVNQ